MDILSSGFSKRKREAEQLGMDYGTASNRLRKKILFRFVQRLGEDICFKCGKQIETPEELSIEHKIPWLNKDPDLFWDLDNIAFSHSRCNQPHTRGIPSNKKIGPEGTAWCNRCKAFLDRSKFQKNRTQWDGLDNFCRECRKLQDRKYKRKG